MEINTKNALKLWEKRNGTAKTITDFTGRYIYKDDYNDRETLRVWEKDGKKYNFGWNIHHIQPLAKGGSNDEQNLEIVCMTTNDEAEDKTTFKANGVNYQVKKIKGSKYHGIYILETGVCVVDHSNE